MRTESKETEEDRKESNITARNRAETRRNATKDIAHVFLKLNTTGTDVLNRGAKLHGIPAHSKE